MAVTSGEFSVTLQRDGTREPFGFRLRGGSDLKEAFLVQRVSVGSPAEGELRRGDNIIKINGRPTSKMTHQEASDLIKKAGTSISLVINRSAVQQPTGQLNKKSADSGPAGLTTSLSGLSRKVTTLSGQPVARKISEIMLSPVENLPVTVFPSANNTNQSEFVSHHEEEMERDRERIVVTHQPYRTTPLVLPGAKVGRDTSSTTQCYLALQQNQPLLWNSPASSAAQHMPVQQQQTDAVLKQKLEAAAAMVQRNLALSTGQQSASAGHQVAVSHDAGEAPQKQGLVHKQFNSPLGLYSNENVQEALALQSGIIPPNPPRHLDLRHSETLRALMEDNGRNVDARGLKETRHNAPAKVVASNPHFKVNVMGVEKEKIQQSYSFKRLMADVLGETDF